MTHTTRTYTHLPLCHGHKLCIVTDTHQHIDRGLYTYMTSYLAQAYRLSILIDKPTLFIDGWLIRLWVNNVLLISTRSLSILMDQPIPLSIGIPTRPTQADNACITRKLCDWYMNTQSCVKNLRSKFEIKLGCALWWRFRALDLCSEVRLQRRMMVPLKGTLGLGTERHLNPPVKVSHRSRVWTEKCKINLRTKFLKGN